MCDVVVDAASMLFKEIYVYRGICTDECVCVREVPLEIVQFLVAFCGPGLDEYKQTKTAIHRIRACRFVFVECVWVCIVCPFFFGLFYAVLRNVRINWNKTRNELSVIMLSHLCSSKFQICHWIFRLKWQSIYGVRVRATDSAWSVKNPIVRERKLWHRCLTNWWRNSGRRHIFETLRPIMISASIRWPFHKTVRHWYPLRITMYSMCTIAIAAPKRVWFICVNTAAVSLISSTMVPKIFWSVPRNEITSFDRSTSKRRAMARTMSDTEISWLRWACIVPAAFSYPPALIKRFACGTHDRHAVSPWPRSMVHRCVLGIQVEFCSASALIRIKFNCSISVAWITDHFAPSNGTRNTIVSGIAWNSRQMANKSSSVRTERNFGSSIRFTGKSCIRF